jgi:hypothetical protein
MWLHADPIHLIGNGIFLWVFGNAVCAKLGNLRYPAAYMGLGIAAAAAYLIFFDKPMLGASGAINGVVGMYFVLYPLNDVSCFYWIFIRVGTFRVASFWMILLWFAFDIWGAIWGASYGNEGVAYVAHLGGFTGGFALMFLLVRTGRVKMGAREKSLLDSLGWMPTAPAGIPDPAPDRLPLGGRSLDDIPDDSLRLPGLDTPPPPPPPAAAPPAAETIAVVCACGKRMRAPRRLAGKKARCPACAGIIEIPR